MMDQKIMVNERLAETELGREILTAEQEAEIFTERPPIEEDEEESTDLLDFARIVRKLREGEEVTEAGEYLAIHGITIMPSPLYYTVEGQVYETLYHELSGRVFRTTGDFIEALNSVLTNHKNGSSGRTSV
jgi:hypothetical protein